MKFETIVKKYRILDYSKLTDTELSERLDYFSKKFDEYLDVPMNHKMVKNMFSIFLNLYDLTEEMFKRFPEYKDSIDFEGIMAEILEKNSINASKN